MSRYSALKLLAASLVLAGLAAPAAAQTFCREGRAGNGQCVNAPLASSLRERANIMSQQKISVTAYPILPSQDYSTPRPVDAQRFELSQPGNFSTNPFPRSP
jgi:hypothetical protein